MRGCTTLEIALKNVLNFTVLHPISNASVVEHASAAYASMINASTV
jgi:hypothetical protein